jgi:hypothetical protein
MGFIDLGLQHGLIPARSFFVHPWATGDTRGGLREYGMSERELRGDDLLSSLVMTIGGTVVTALSIALVIIWFCS